MTNDMDNLLASTESAHLFGHQSRFASSRRSRGGFSLVPHDVAGRSTRSAQNGSPELVADRGACSNGEPIGASLVIRAAGVFRPALAVPSA